MQKPRLISVPCTHTHHETHFKCARLSVKIQFTWLVVLASGGITRDISQGMIESRLATRIYVETHSVSGNTFRIDKWIALVESRLAARIYAETHFVSNRSTSFLS